MRYNPFKPNSPIYSGMFSGRYDEISAIERALVQTKNGNPTHIMLVGERGIGKTSLLLLGEKVANGSIEDVYGKSHRFLTIQISITSKMSLMDFATALRNRVDREMKKVNPTTSLVKDSWEFVSRFEIAGVSYKGETKAAEKNQIIEDLTYSLIDTIKNITDSTRIKGIGLGKTYDGIVLLIDEADSSSIDLDLGTFLKKLSEQLVAEDCNKILFIIAGLPNLHEVLYKSHESSLRLFREFQLSPLSKKEVKQVIENGLKESAEKSEGGAFDMEASAMELIYEYSEGYPHFVQQIGFSVFEKNDTNAKILENDVKVAFLGKNGALYEIGERYYKKLYYDDINTEAQREILDIMAESWNDWISRDVIAKKYSKAKTSLDNGIRALKEKNIILTKEGSKGQYRLQWVSFAYWIKSHKEIRK